MKTHIQIRDTTPQRDGTQKQNERQLCQTYLPIPK